MIFGIIPWALLRFFFNFKKSKKKKKGKTEDSGFTNVAVGTQGLPT